MNGESSGMWEMPDADENPEARGWRAMSNSQSGARLGYSTNTDPGTGVGVIVLGEDDTASAESNTTSTGVSGQSGGVRRVHI